MNSIIEEKRTLHEERDRVEQAIVNEMLSKKTGHRDKLESEHRQKALLDRYMKCSKDLLALYESEADQMCKSKSKTNSSVFSEFYLALRDIKEFYSKHSNEQVVTLASEFDEIEAARQIALGVKTKQQKEGIRDTAQGNPQDDDIDESLDAESLDREGEIGRLTRGLPTTDLVDIVDTPNIAAPIVTRVEKQIEFTDEEGYGRYLDLTKCHEAFLQVVKRETNKPNYLTFLDKFDHFNDLDREYRLSSAYKTYIEMMLEYFRGFCRRAKPLLDYQDLEDKVNEKFLQQWKDRTIPGWFNDSDRTISNDTQMVDLESFKSCDELMELGLECLKKELQVRGLKCGGTLEERAKRLWSVRGKSANEIDDTLRAGSITTKKGKKRSAINPFHIASIESKLSMYSEYFNDQRQATIENVQRKQARTAEERNESDDEISDIDDEDNNQDEVIYNPKNLPLGWDGKPIPYWLYKLHGLNLTFTCEICGNATYKGPKTFQRHFAEWRHAHGMRCLGIPNTAHFANITNIQDAINLWDKLKSERQKDKSQPLNEEEYEDSQGNVVNKKTYEDLKRQGLL